jgi:hypothetical protein
VEIGQKQKDKFHVLHKTDTIKKELNPSWPAVNASITVDTSQPLILVMNDWYVLFLSSFYLDFILFSYLFYIRFKFVLNSFYIRFIFVLYSFYIRFIFVLYSFYIRFISF